jgi:hypothetical protein
MEFLSLTGMNVAKTGWIDVNIQDVGFDIIDDWNNVLIENESA